MKTGEIIAQVMGDARSVSERLVSERNRQGLRVSMAQSRTGYVISKIGENGLLEPIIAVRQTEPVKISKLILKYLINGILILISVGLSLIVHYFAKGMNDSFDELIDLRKTRGARALLGLLG